jgi:hypothetical protein
VERRRARAVLCEPIPFGRARPTPSVRHRLAPADAPQESAVSVPGTRNASSTSLARERRCGVRVSPGQIIDRPRPMVDAPSVAPNANRSRTCRVEVAPFSRPASQPTGLAPSQHTLAREASRSPTMLRRHERHGALREGLLATTPP